MLEGVVLKMFCSRCGHKVNDEAGFCPICGARIVDNAPGVRVGRGNEGAPSSEEAPLQGAGNGATLRNTRDEACNREVAHGIQPKNKGAKKLVVALAAVLVAGTGGYAIWQAKPSAPRASQVKADTAGGRQNLPIREVRAVRKRQRDGRKAKGFSRNSMSLI